MVTMIAMGIKEPGDVVQATVETSLLKGFTAVTNIVFAFGMYTSRFSPASSFNSNNPSWTRRLLRSDGRTERPPRLPQSYLPPPRPGHLALRSGRRRHLPLWGTQSRFSSTGICRTSFVESRLWHCPAYRMSPPEDSQNYS